MKLQVTETESGRLYCVILTEVEAKNMVIENIALHMMTGKNVGPYTTGIAKTIAEEDLRLGPSKNESDMKAAKEEFNKALKNLTQAIIGEQGPSHE